MATAQTKESDYDIQYRSPIQPRTATMSTQRRSSGSFSPGPGGGRVLSIVTEMGMGSVGLVGASPALTKDAAESFVKVQSNSKVL